MVESTALEMRRTGNRTVGSNPTLSATHWAKQSPLLGGYSKLAEQPTGLGRRPFRSFAPEQGQLTWPCLSRCDARATSRIKKKEQGNPMRLIVTHRKIVSEIEAAIPLARADEPVFRH